MKLAKRYSVILISICLLIGMLQFGVLASEEEPAPPEEQLHAINISDLEDGVSNWVRANRISPNNDLVAVGSRGVQKVYVFELETGELVWEGAHTAEVPSVAWNSDGSILASGSMDGVIKIWDAATGDELETIQTFSQVEWIVFSPDDSVLYNYGRADGVYMWDTETWDIIREKRASAPSGNHIVDVSPDGERLAVIVDATVEIWDPISLRTIATLKPLDVHNLEITRLRDVRWSNDGSKVAIGGDSGVIIWDTDNYTTALEILGETGLIYGIAWSPEDDKIAAGCNTNNVFIFDTATGEKLSTFPVGTTVLSTDWSADGKYVTAGNSGECTLYIYDVE